MPHHHPGTTLGAFRLADVVGRGGMGVVFRARQEGLGREVAVKLVSPEWCGDPRFRARVRREARLAASVEHPHVLPIYDAGEVDGAAYVAMRYVPGPDLRALVRAAGPLDPERATRLVAQVGAALDAAHRRGLVHRDVKPSNVLVDEVDGHDHAYLTDFGLARPAADGHTPTADGGWAGTADYAAPEQIRGGRGDARTDVYALGGVLFWALTGEVPFRRDNQEARLWAHLTATPPAPSALVPGLPPALDAVVARALAKEPDDRFPSAGALGRAALEAAGAAVPALARPAGAGGAAGEETLTGDALATPALAATAVGRRPDPADDTRTLAGRERGRHRRRRLLAASVMLAAGSAGAVAASGGAGDEAAAGGRVPAGDARPAARPHDFAGDRRLDLVAAHPGEDGGAPRRIVSPGAGQPQRTPVTASPRSPRWAGTKRAS